MGLLRTIVESFKGQEPENPDLLREFEEAGKKDAEKIAKKMGQDKPSFVQHVDVETLPVEMPVESGQDEREHDDGSR